MAVTGSRRSPSCRPTRPGPQLCGRHPGARQGRRPARVRAARHRADRGRLEVRRTGAPGAGGGLRGPRCPIALARGTAFGGRRPMNGRERLRAALDRRRRTARLLYQGTPEVDAELRAHLGLPSQEALLTALGQDMRHVARATAAPNCAPGRTAAAGCGRSAIATCPMVTAWGPIPRPPSCPLPRRTRRVTWTATASPAPTGGTMVR